MSSRIGEPSDDAPDMSDNADNPYPVDREQRVGYSAEERAMRIERER